MEPDPHPGVERGVGVLEHELEVPPAAAQLPLPPSRLSSLALEAERPGVGPLERHQQPAHRGLAAARLADQAEGLAPADRERDVGDRLDRADLAAEEAARQHRELLDQVVDPEDHRGAASELGPRAGAPARRLAADRPDRGRAPGLGWWVTGWKQAKRWTVARPGAVGVGEGRVLLAALVGGVLAAGGEPAVGVGLGEVGRQAGDADSSRSAGSWSSLGTEASRASE